MLRAVLSILPALFLVGSSVVLVFVNLCGTSNLGVLSNLYWSQTSTSIGLHSLKYVRWSSYSLCEYYNQTLAVCTDLTAGFPYSPEDNFHTTSLPDEFIKRRNFFYYGSRASFALLLISLIITLLALILEFLSFIIAKLFVDMMVMLLVFFSLISTFVAAVMLSVSHSKGVAAFNQAGYLSKMGTKMFSLLWVAFGFQLICFGAVLFVSSYSISIKKKQKKTKKKDKKKDKKEEKKEEKKGEKKGEKTGGKQKTKKRFKGWTISISKA